MHDEFERAMTGRTPRKGLSPLGWVLAGTGLLVTVGMVGAGFAVRRVVSRVDRRIERVTHRFGATPSLAVANVIGRLAQAPDLVSMEPESGLSLISDLANGDFGGEVQRVMEQADFRMPDGSAHPDATGATGAPAAPEVAIDGRSVNIKSADGNVAISLRGARNGGFLTIDSDQGKVRFDLRADDNGGHLTVSTDDGTFDVTLGREAARQPGWVDDVAVLPFDAQPVASLSSEDAQMGALVWKGEEAPGEVLLRYQDRLDAAGYEVRVRESFRQSGVEQASLWARNEADGRMLFLVARRAQGRTDVLLGFGEKS